MHIYFTSLQSLSRFRLFATPWATAHQASLSITNSWSSLKPMSIESVMPSNHLMLCRPLLLPPSIFPSIRVLSNESVLRIRWPRNSPRAWPPTFGNFCHLECRYKPITLFHVSGSNDELHVIGIHRNFRLVLHRNTLSGCTDIFMSSQWYSSRRIRVHRKTAPGS